MRSRYSLLLKCVMLGYLGMALLFIMAGGCSDQKREENESEEVEMTVHFWVTNSSFIENPTVKIEIDGKLAFNDPVVRGTGHGYVEREIKLARGRHSLDVSAAGKQVYLEDTIEVESELWVRVILMNDERGDGQQFVIDMSRLKPVIK